MNDDSEVERVEHRRGIPAARAFHLVARISAERYLSAKEDSPVRPYDMILYYGAFWLYCKSALQALERSDAKQSDRLKIIQRDYFERHIKNDPIFKLLEGERHRVSHGDDSWAFHPFKPDQSIDRFLNEGHDLFDLFDADFWPDGPLKGATVQEVINVVWKTVGRWLDDVDILDDAQHRAANKG